MKKMIIGLYAILFFLHAMPAQANLCQNLWKANEAKAKDEPVAAEQPKPAPPSHMLEGLSKMSTLQLKVDPFSTGEQAKTEQYKASLNNVLRMMTETMNTSGGVKITLEKGELTLGHVLKNGMSVEFEYVIDKRNPNGDVFRLSKVVLLSATANTLSGGKIDRPVGDVEGVLTTPEVVVGLGGTEAKRITRDALVKKAAGNEPLLAALKEIKEDATVTETLTALLKEFPELLSAADKAQLETMMKSVEEVMVPTAISGTMLKDINTWVKDMKHIKRDDLRAAVGKKSTNGLLLRGQIIGKVDFVTKVAVKQGVKWGLVILFLNAMNVTNVTRTGLPEQAPATINYTADVAPGHINMKLGDAQVPAVQVMRDSSANTVNTLASSLKLSPASSALLKTKISEQAANMNTSASIVQRTQSADVMIEGLLNAEVANANGSAKFFLGDGGSMTLTSSTTKPTPDAMAQSSLMVAQFTSQRTIIVAPITQATAMSAPQTTLIRVTQEGQPALYAELEAGLKKVVTTGAAGGAP